MMLVVPGAYKRREFIRSWWYQCEQYFQYIFQVDIA